MARSSEAKFYRRLSVAAGVAMIGGTAIVASDEIVSDALHDATAQEEQISAALDAALDTDVKVRCVEDMVAEEGLNGRQLSFFGKVTAFGNTRFVRLDQGHCDTISAVLDTTGSYELTVEAKDNLQVAVHAATHEAMHRKFPTARESETNCYALQAMGQVGTAIGLTPLQANAITNYYVDSSPRTYPNGYAPPVDCVDGGQYDLNIPALVGNRPGYFPRFLTPEDYDANWFRAS